MKNLSMDDIGTIPGGEYERVEVDGILNITGPLTARRLIVDGVVNAKAELSIEEKLVVDGVLSAEGAVRGDTIKIDGIATVDGNMRGKRISVDGCFVMRGEKLEADRITGGGIITVTGEVNADLVKLDGVLRANVIFGDRIVIEGERRASFWKWLSRYPQEGPLKINLIEATSVEIGGLEVAEISAQQIVLHDGCRVDKVYCTERLVIEDGASVGEITGDALVIRR